MRDLEHQHAVALCHWWALEANRRGIDERLLMAIPNGGLRNIRVAMKLKHEGVRAGVPDYLLAIPNKKKGIPGLWIELKTPKGRASDSQNQVIEELIRQGYSVIISYGWDAARVAITNHLDDIWRN